MRAGARGRRRQAALVALARAADEALALNGAGFVGGESHMQASSSAGRVALARVLHTDEEGQGARGRQCAVGGDHDRLPAERARPRVPGRREGEARPAGVTARRHRRGGRHGIAEARHGVAEIPPSTTSGAAETSRRGASRAAGRAPQGPTTRSIAAPPQSEGKGGGRSATSGRSSPTSRVFAQPAMPAAQTKLLAVSRPWPPARPMPPARTGPAARRPPRRESGVPPRAGATEPGLRARRRRAAPSPGVHPRRRRWPRRRPARPWPRRARHWCSARARRPCPPPCAGRAPPRPPPAARRSRPASW